MVRASLDNRLLVFFTEPEVKLLSSKPATKNGQLNRVSERMERGGDMLGSGLYMRSEAA